MSRTVGNAKAGEVEVRYATVQIRRGEIEEFDEVVASNAHVHLEKMDDQWFSLIIETSKERACFRIHSKNWRAHIDGNEFWRDSINRRSEGNGAGSRVNARPAGNIGRNRGQIVET